ncbi:unnamed protein product [Rotaria socialis]|uniref:Uncharacterized protein n=1 Tax=Rotaria socialis TaxID=392032 RepID=A0A820CPX7_9BILA|nr:unnamed protein product [Rotaria socialis]CAF3355744.1 unnamed protein product [Rotaria socialis]CAF3428983.1 unnamed protein product [Rotaria socialis]CAF3433831.1 unnamed protein product [Rotaria socialis]CAF4221067.1 unnamed protein product [Rotaria socialis]
MLAVRKLDQQVVRPASNANVGLSGALATCCAIFVLFAIAATIVLSLIPLYVPTKIAERSIAATQSGPVTMQLNTGISVGSRRKRYDPSLLIEVDEAIGYKFGSNSVQSIQIQIENMFIDVTNDAQSITIIEVTITAINTKRKRHTIQKRAGAVAVVQLLFYVNFKSTCSDSCINKAGALLEVALPSRVKTDSIILNNVTIIDDDGKEFGIISSIPIIDLAYLSFIGTKKSKKVHTTPRTTAAVTAEKKTTTTTTSVSTTTLTRITTSTTGK